MEYGYLIFSSSNPIVHCNHLAFGISCTIYFAFTAVAPPAGSLVIPDDFSTIQAAIGNASAGDTVFVKSGIYSERIVIDKSLSLIGEDPRSTLLTDYPRMPIPWAAIKVTAGDVTISGFTIRNADEGITITEEYQTTQPKRCRIIGNNIEASYYVGIFLQSGENHVISGNNITGNRDHGISVYASNSVISGNNITENGGYGKDYGGAGIGAYNEKITISNNDISNNTNGLELWIGSFDVYGNNITDNQGYGVQFADGCNNTPLHDNNITRNDIGIDLKNFATEGYAIGSGNTVYRNNVMNNVQQAVINTKWAYDIGDNLPSSNGTDIVSWDNGNEGNYWSDYQSKYPNATEIGTSGVGDTSYLIDVNNIDHYPLMQPVDISKASPSTSTPLPDSLLIIAVVVIVVITAVLLIAYKARTKGSKSQTE